MFPQFKNVQVVGKDSTFTVSDTECYFVNCLRRSIIADVNTVAFPEFSEENSLMQREEKKEDKKRKLFLSLFVEDLLEKGSILNYSPGFITVHENTSNFHNEIVMKRLSLIPVFLNPIEFLHNPSKYTFSINVTHDTSSTLSLLDVTTADIKFHVATDKEGEEGATEEDDDNNDDNNNDNDNDNDKDDSDERKQLLRSIFPPHTISLESAIFEKVKSKLFHDGTTFSEETSSVHTPLLLLKLLPGQTLRVTMRPSVSSSFFHAAYGAVTHAYYTNTLCQTKITEKKSSFEDVTIHGQEDFECHGKYRHFITNERGVASSFDFVLKSIGSFACHEIVELALQTMILRLSKMKKQLSLTQLAEKTLPPPTPFVEDREFFHYTLRIPEVYPSSFVSNTKFHMNNGHTIANLIQGVLYNFYTLERKDDLVLVSYRKPSPLDIRQDHETLLATDIHFPHALDPHIEYLFVWGIEKDAESFSKTEALERISVYIDFVKMYVEGALQNFQLAVAGGEEKMI